MVVASDGLINATRLAGNVLRVRYYTETLQGGSVWDDRRTFAQSGTDLYISGVIQKIDATRGSEDAILMEQGRLTTNDLKMFVNGSIQTTSGLRVFTMAISGADIVYREQEGVTAPQYFGADIYKKIYLSIQQLGSLF